MNLVDFVLLADVVEALINQLYSLHGFHGPRNVFLELILKANDIDNQNCEVLIFVNLRLLIDKVIYDVNGNNLLNSVEVAFCFDSDNAFKVESFSFIALCVVGYCEHNA